MSVCIYGARVNVCMRRHMGKRALLSVCVWVYTYAVVCLCMYTCLFVGVPSCLHVCRYRFMGVCVSVCMYICMDACVQVCMYVVCVAWFLPLPIPLPPLRAGVGGVFLLGCSPPWARPVCVSVRGRTSGWVSFFPRVTPALPFLFLLRFPWPPVPFLFSPHPTTPFSPRRVLRLPSSLLPSPASLCSLLPQFPCIPPLPGIVRWSFRSPLVR
jgi:hypothetical protein